MVTGGEHAGAAVFGRVEDQPGSGRIIKLQLLEREGRCGDGALQLGEDCDGSDCLNAPYPPAARGVYSTGMVEASFLNGNPKVGNGMISAHGEPFECTAWTAEDGPGQLAGTYLVEENPQAGDVANVNVLDD